MKLQDEYVRRHGINKDFIYHCDNINVILRSKNYHWVILNARWNPATWHPGYYIFKIIKPVHNSHVDRFNNLIDPTVIHWEEYEKFIMEWLITLTSPKFSIFKAIEDPLEAVLNTWEIFLYTHDAWVASNTSSEFLKLVEVITRPDMSYDMRYEAHLRATQLLGDKEILFWNIASYSEHYCVWLAKLINRVLTQQNN
jgi:hypothetical protein